MNSLLYSAAACARLLSQLAPAFEDGELVAPADVVTRPLSQAAQAYAALQGGQKGKLVIVPVNVRLANRCPPFRPPFAVNVSPINAWLKVLN